MTSSIDNKVVQMTFDNAEFQRKLADTLKSMEDLKKSLDFSAQKNSLKEVSDSVGRFNLHGLLSATDEAGKGFLALSTIAISALATITVKAVDTGIAIVKHLSVDTILSGFHEMETNMNAIQTILANTSSKGSTLDDVNRALDTLNTYSDQTIYNFTEMAKNIGTFTAAGIDLDASVNAIKGIANLAAISGSNADQASTAMYQLSQALATGQVHLMDWNSVVNAGLGGEVFQKALFETGKALGTLQQKFTKTVVEVDKKGKKTTKTIDEMRKVPIDQTFEEWKAAGNSFRDSLQDGWINTKVLTTTLQAFTGDLSVAQLKALGYTDKQAEEMAKLGKLGKSAATEVKTLTQLIGTVKEAIGSGWTKSFQIIFGNFEEAKSLFTGVNNIIGKFVSDNAEHRNKILQDWKALGGRNVAFEGIVNAIRAFNSVIKPIKDAMKEIFPPITGQRLFNLTVAFRDFTTRMIIGADTAAKIKHIFVGFFDGIKIGIEIVKQIARTFKTLFETLSGKANAGDFLINFSDKIQALKEKFVDEGGIKKFFDRIIAFIKNPSDLIDGFKAKVQGFIDNLKVIILKPINAIESVKAKIVDFLSGDHLPDGLPKIFDRVQQRLEAIERVGLRIRHAFDWVVDTLKSVLKPIVKALDFIWEAISNWFKDLSTKMADALNQPGEFQGALDAVNTGLIGAIALMLKKFLGGGLNVDLGGGFLQKLGTSLDTMNKTFGALTGTLQAMQQQIKANTLVKIAGAVALLTASILVLSLINSEALTKALTALSVGFIQLIGTLSLLSKIGGPDVKGGLKVAFLAAAMIEISTAALILSAALKILGTMSWEEIERGLAAMAGLLAGLVGTAKLLSGNSVGLVLAGAGIVEISLAMVVLAGAMKIFATMSWTEIAKGLAAVAGSLLAIAAATQLMPSVTLPLIGVGLIAIGVALNLIGAAMKIFATMTWKDIGKGLTVLAGGLAIIALAMNAMPITLPITAAGLILVGIALNILAPALKMLGDMSWSEIGRGLTALAGALTILAITMTAMIVALPGALALSVVSVALLALVKVVQEFSGMSWKSLAKGLVSLAASLAAIALVATLLEPAVPAIFALGAALTLLGAAFVLFGAGSLLVAAAFAAMAKAGKAGVETMIYFIDQLVGKLPTIATAAGVALIKVVETFLSAGPTLVTMLGVLLEKILVTITDLLPALTQTVISLIDHILEVIRAKSPDVIATGFQVLMDFLHGIDNNIGQITSTIASIITKFLDGLASKAPDIVAAGLNLVVAFLQGIADKIDDVVAQGVAIVVAVIQGVTDQIDELVTAAVGLVTSFIKALGEQIDDVVKAGVDIVTNIITGIGKGFIDIASKAGDMVIEFLGAIGKKSAEIAAAAFQMVIDFINSLADTIEEKTPELRKAGEHLAGAVLDGMTFGVSGKIGDVAGKIKDGVGGAIDGVKGILHIGGPSKVFCEIGRNVMDGFAAGIDGKAPVVTNSIVDMAKVAASTMHKSLSKMPDLLANMDEFNPTVTPVLDLSQIKDQAGQFGKMFGTPTIGARVSIDQAARVSDETLRAQAALTDASTPEKPVVKEFNLTQNNYSPKALSVADIYRKTRSQIELTKRDLEVASA